MQAATSHRFGPWAAKIGFIINELRQIMLTRFSHVAPSVSGRFLVRPMQRGAPMQTHQLSWSAVNGWRAAGADFASADLVLYFGLRSALAAGARHPAPRATVD